MPADASSKPKYSPGLAGVIAGETSIATVGKGGHGLMYRGYSIEDLCNNCIFEEVAYLLLYGELPTKQELAAYKRQLAGYRKLLPAVRQAMEILPGDSHPMDVLKVGCAVQGTLQREQSPPGADFKEFAGPLTAMDVFNSLIASFGSMQLYHYHFHKNGKRIDTAGKPEDTIASHYIRLLHGTEPDPLHVNVFDTLLILYAEHGLAASTFSCRVTTSTLSDSYSAVCAAIGTLRGPLHGGANEAAMNLIEQFSTPESAERGVRDMLRRKAKIMGFGHRVYKTSDPRNIIVKALSKQLSEQPNGKATLFKVSETIEKLMWNEKKLFPNLDFYAASAYHQCGIPTSLFTPIFVIARSAGWGANIIEQRAANRLIRPAALYVGPNLKQFVKMDDRVSTKSRL